MTTSSLFFAFSPALATDPVSTAAPVVVRSVLTGLLSLASSRVRCSPYSRPVWTVAE